MYYFDQSFLRLLVFLLLLVNLYLILLISCFHFSCRIIQIVHESNGHFSNTTYNRYLTSIVGKRYLALSFLLLFGSESHRQHNESHLATPPTAGRLSNVVCRVDSRVLYVYVVGCRMPDADNRPMAENYFKF